MGAKSAPAASAREEEDLAAICERIADEIEQLRVLGARLEQSLCAAHVNEGLTAERVRDMQQFDFLIQHLAALRDFLSALSTTAALDLRVDATAALSRVVLGALKERLAGAADADSAEASGGVELF